MHNVNLSVLFLATSVPAWLAVVIAVAAVAIGGFVGLFIYKSTTEKKVGSAQEQVRKIVSDAESEAERLKAHGKEERKRGSTPEGGGREDSRQKDY